MPLLHHAHAHMHVHQGLLPAKAPLLNLQEYLDVVQNRSKEKRYTFDVAFDPDVRAEGSASCVVSSGAACSQQPC